ncbi:sigma-70 family RNA polymerase sigma factor [Micromonospora sediminicola]|uniref:sigma-70 family RNA polymerase sigma factor n=1 Tax=Micromonospora sediminicola TaxID=946078 RepID=UPI001FE02E76
MARAQAGDAEAFGLVYDRYVDQVFQFVSQRVRDRQAAEDLTSETFLRALRNLDAFRRPGGDFGAWITTIARNLILNHHESRFEVPVAEHRDEAESGQVPDPAKTAMDRLTHEALLAGVDQLSAPQRQCIILRYLRELSIDETAQAMGRTPAAIKAIQHKALRALRGLLPVGVVMPA